MTAAISTANSSNIVQGSAAVIACKLPDGKGDVAVGHAIYQLMQRCFPQLEVMFSYANPEPSHYDALHATLPRVDLTEEDEKRWNVTKISTVFSRIQKNQFQFILLTSANEDILIPPTILKAPVPIIKFQEYGMISDDVSTRLKPPVYTLGLAEEELGVIFPHELYQTYLSPKEYQSMKSQIPLIGGNAKLVLDYLGYEEDSARSRLEHMKSLPPEFVELVLNGRFAQIPANDEVLINRFVNSSKLYCAYALIPSIQSAFIGAICCQPKETSNITICILKEYSNAVLEPGGLPFDELMQLQNRNLIAAGFHRIETFYRENKLIKRKTVTINATGQRVLRIIFHPLSVIEADTLAKASERETMTTGDSSFLKALALNKITAYEMRRHKAAFMRSFIGIAEKKNAALATALSLCIFGNLQRSEYVPFAFQTRVKEMAQFFEKMKTDQKLNTSWNKVIHDIQSLHIKFEQKLSRIVVQNIEIFEKLQKRREELKKSKKLPQS